MIFTADDKSMYINTDTTIGLHATSDIFDANNHNLPKNFPKALFLQILKIVTMNNYFSFASIYWLQLFGTTMRTPTACAYATTTYGHFKNTMLLPKDNLIYYRHYIYNVLGIWLTSTFNKDSCWGPFKNMMNNWNTLQWEIEDLNRKTYFLDLNITIQDHSSLQFSTYQKKPESLSILTIPIYTSS